MKDQESSGSDQVRVQQLYKKGKIFPGDSGGETDMDVTVQSNTVTIAARSAYTDLKYCYLEIYVPVSFAMQSFNFLCTGDEADQCVFVQKGSQKTIGTVSITEQSTGKGKLGANFQDVKVSTALTFTAFNGILLLPLVELTASTAVTVSIQFGEVVLQSTFPDMKVTWENNYAYSVCMASDASNSMTIDNTKTDCYYSKDTKSVYAALNDYTNQDVSTPCKGEVVFGAGSSAVAANVNYGSIYVNYVTSAKKKLDDTNDALKLIKTYVYDAGQLRLNQDALTKIEMLKNQTSVEAEPIWIVDIRNRFLQSSTSSYWVKSSNPTFAQMRPWWLATVSLSLLVTQTSRLDAVLAPGICPYR